MEAESSSKKKKLVPTLYIVGGVVGVLLLGALMLFGVSWAAGRFALELDVIRDLFIIALALEACLFGLVLVILLVMVIRLVNTVEYEIKPILHKANQITTTAQTTTEFVSENIVQPTVKAKGYVAGARAGAKALFGNPQKNLPK